MSLDLRGRVVLVTGGATGIGRAIVLGAAQAGAKVVFCGRTEGEQAARTLAEAQALTEALFVRADVGDESQVDALFDAAIDRFDRVDAVVNNAGTNRDALLVHTSTEDFDAILRTNLTGAFLVSRRAVQEMLAQGEGGRIVSIGSISQAGATSQAAYAASKGALTGLTRTLAKEYGPRGITANVVVAGLVHTDLSARLPQALHDFMVQHAALRRAGEADEVAAAALWLASSASSYVNGAELHASGGWRDVPW